MPVTDGNCGNIYRSSVVTADGYSLDNPYGRFAVWTDYSGWKIATLQTINRMNEHYAALAKAEGEPLAAWRAFFVRHNEINVAYKMLPKPSAWMLGGTIIESIGAAVGVVVDALCAMEQYDNAILAIPGASPPPPVPTTVKPEPKPKPVLDIIPDTANKLADTAIKLGAVAVGAYLVVNLVKKK